VLTSILLTSLSCVPSEIFDELTWKWSNSPSILKLRVAAGWLALQFPQPLALFLCWLVNGAFHHPINHIITLSSSHGSNSTVHPICPIEFWKEHKKTSPATHQKPPISNHLHVEAPPDIRHAPCLAENGRALAAWHWSCSCHRPVDRRPLEPARFLEVTRLPSENFSYWKINPPCFIGNSW